MASTQRSKTEMQKYIQCLKERQILLMRRQNLQQLSIQAIARNCNSFFKDKQQPFACLPPPLLELLLEYLKSKGFLSGTKVLPLLPGPNCTRLDLDLSQPGVWTPEEASKLVQLVADKNSGRLRVLSLQLPVHGRGSPSPLLGTKQLSCLLARLAGLTELTLRECHLKNSNMAAIGANCKQLRRLDVSHNHQLTDGGVIMLFSPPRGHCLLLEYLNLHATGVTHGGLGAALGSLPHLRALVHRAVGFMAKTKKLEYLCIESNNVKYLKDLSEQTSHVKSLELICGNVLSSLIDNLPNVVDLKMISFCYKEELLFEKGFGCQLTRLELGNSVYSIYSMDLSIIGYLCINLKHFKFHGGSKLEIKYILDLDTHFTKLITCEISLTIYNDYNLNSTLLMIMLSSSSLESITMVNVAACEVVMAYLVREALVNKSLDDSLSQLRELRLVGKYTLLLDTAKRLVCCTPHLRTLCLPKFLGLQNFLDNNKIKVNLITPGK